MTTNQKTWLKSILAVALAITLCAGVATGADRDSEGAFHGNVRSHKFHRPGCRYYRCRNCTAVFPSRKAAIAAGYEPCGICKP